MSKKRNQNFTEAELNILSDQVESQKDILFSKHSTVATNAAKNRAWESICSKVNACNLNHKQTAEEIKKKWSTLTSTVKKQASFVRREAKKTGGGPPPDSLTPLQNKVVGIIGDTPIDGIASGIDTCQAAGSPMDHSRDEIEFTSETVLPSTSGISSAKDDNSIFTRTLSSPHTEESLVEIEREDWE